MNSTKQSDDFPMRYSHGKWRRVAEEKKTLEEVDSRDTATISALQEEMLRLTAELTQVDWAIWGDDKPAIVGYEPDRAEAIEQLKRRANSEKGPSVVDGNEEHLAAQGNPKTSEVT